jgi:flagellar P-ring protein precursor FlgI
MTPLKAADGQVYAQAQGNLVIGGSRAATGGAATSVNHLNAGRIPAGGIIERAVPSLLVDEFVQIDLRVADFAMMQKTAEAIGRRFGLGTALPIDARSMNVRVPVEPLRRTAFMAALQDLDVPIVSGPARVILNSRTGSVVMNQAVQLSPSAVAHGNLTVKVQKSPTVSQPLPFSRGQTTIATQDTATIEDSGKENSLIAIPGGASLDQVVRALNMLGATPQDLIAILQSLKSAGALRAELEVI